jgi:uncharacterized protein (PEP-CTERM system associated)
MATTADARVLPARRAGRAPGPLSRAASGLIRAFTTVGLAVVAGAATAQVWHSEVRIGGQVTITDNANFESGTAKESDVIINVFPAIRFTRDGGRLRIDGAAALNLVGYVQGTQTSRMLPQANILAELEAVERFFFVEGEIVVNQDLLNPFLPRSDSASTFNKYTYGQVRLAPYIKGNLGPSMRYIVRSDNSYSFSTQTNAPLNNAYLGKHFAEITRTPEPIGWSARVQRDLTRYADQVQPDATLDLALARLLWEASPQLILGLRGGYENTNYTLSETSGPIYGADVEWSPSPVTRLSGYWESRFFGPSYRLDASHRGPQYSASIGFSRLLQTYPELLFRLPATGNLSGLLDAILVSRFPDPVERSKQVQDLIARQGLPDSLPGAVNIYSQSPNIVTAGDVNFALIGVRNTLAFGLFYTKTQELPDARLPPTFFGFNNNVQKGVSITLSHRLTQLINLNAITRWTETEGLDQSSGDYTNQALVHLQATYQLAPRTNAFAATRYQIVASNVRVDATEAALLFGLTHRF